MTTSHVLPSRLPESHPLQLAAAGYLARFKGISRTHAESDLRAYLRRCADRGLELAELILIRKGSRSYSDLADRSGLSRAAIHRLTKSSIRTVPDTLRGLAAALDVSIDRVAVAALRAAGVPVTDRFAAGDVLEGLDRLTPHQRAAIQRLVEVMINPTTPR